MLSLPEVAEQLGVRRQTMGAWVRAGRVPAQRVGAVYAIDVADIPAIKAQLASWTGENGMKTDTQLPVITPAELAGYVAIADAAADLGRDVMTLRRWVKAGQVAGFRLGLHRVYLRAVDVAVIKGNIAGGRRPLEGVVGPRAAWVAGQAGAGEGGDRGG